MEREKLQELIKQMTLEEKRPCVLAQISGIRKALTGWGYRQ